MIGEVVCQSTCLKDHNILSCFWSFSAVSNSFEVFFEVLWCFQTSFELFSIEHGQGQQNLELASRLHVLVQSTALEGMDDEAHGLAFEVAE